MNVGNGIVIDFNDFTPDELQVAASEIAKAADSKCVALPLLCSTPQNISVPKSNSAEKATAIAKSAIIPPAVRKRAGLAIKILASRFKRSESDFSVVGFVSNQDKNTLAVALVANEGIDIGDVRKTWDAKRNWDEVLAQERRGQFTVVLEGVAVDVLGDVDGRLLTAIAAANPAIDEWVWRTGEKEMATSQGAPVAFLRMGKAMLDLDFRSDSYKNTLVRPAIIL